MINSTSSSDRVLRPDGVVHHAKSPPADKAGTDRFSPENSTALKSALERHPEIRPEVIARARVLATDPSYPSPAILRRVGEVILASPDPADQTD